MSEQFIEKTSPFFEGEDGAKNVLAHVDKYGNVEFKREKVIVGCMQATARIWARWIDDNGGDVISKRWDGSDDELYFTSLIRRGPVRLSEHYDSENDYPDDDWPEPREIVMSSRGAAALARWVLLNVGLRRCPAEGCEAEVLHEDTDLLGPVMFDPGSKHIWTHDHGNCSEYFLLEVEQAVVRGHLEKPDERARSFYRLGRRVHSCTAADEEVRKRMNQLARNFRNSRRP